MKRSMSTRLSRGVRKKLSRGKINRENASRYLEKVNNKLLELNTEYRGLNEYLKNKKALETRETLSRETEKVNKATKHVASELAAESVLATIPGGMAAAIGAQAKEEGVPIKEVASRMKKSQIKELGKNTKESRIQVDAATKALRTIDKKPVEDLRKRKEELERKLRDLESLKTTLESYL